ncbi:MAG TPA: DUF6134 family protein [Saprospiraceae bacterium]|nr:DUF6134 family protein [Saprospiraceae bacterium]
MILMVVLATFLLAQGSTLEYTIKQRGIPIGNLQFTQSVSAEMTVLRLESHAEPRVVFALTINAKEESIYNNDIMTFSSICRLFNNKGKLNKKTRLKGDGYEIQKGDHIEILQLKPIRFNMLCMYAREPKGISKVYSDILQHFLDIKQIANHHYQIHFPDGTYNEYFYENGICTRIAVYHTLYTGSIELKPYQ